MNREELFKELNGLVERIDTEEAPHASAVLYTLLGAMASGRDDALYQIVIPFAAAERDRMKAEMN